MFTDPGDVQVYVNLFTRAEAAAVFGDEVRRELVRRPSILRIV